MHSRSLASYPGHPMSRATLKNMGGPGYKDSQSPHIKLDRLDFTEPRTSPQHFRHEVYNYYY